MGKKGRRQALQQKQSVKGPWRRYGFWILGAALVVMLVVIGIIVSQGDEDRSTSFTTLSLTEIPRTSPEAVKAKMDTGANITIVDARSKADYEQSHIAGAISIPLEEIAQRYKELNSDNEVVLYCT